MTRVVDAHMHIRDARRADYSWLDAVSLEPRVVGVVACAPLREPRAVEVLLETWCERPVVQPRW